MIQNSPLSFCILQDIAPKNELLKSELQIIFPAFLLSRGKIQRLFRGHTHRFKSVHLSEGLVLNLCAYLVEIGTLLELRKEALYPFVHLPSLFFRRSLPLACHTITQVHFAGGSVVSSEP